MEGTFGRIHRLAREDLPQLRQPWQHRRITGEQYLNWVLAGRLEHDSGERISWREWQRKRLGEQQV